MKIKVCNCVQCQNGGGRHDIIRRKLRAEKRKNRVALRRGDEPSKGVGCGYTD